ncbi:MAG: hypothetical protein H8E64_03770 [Candidatus Marinimicrobia bacterium]|nr:hypothetical protein [Candidatus Neomarinimicrobiota bacterium]
MNNIWKENKRHFLIWGIVVIMIIVALRLGIDEKIVVFLTLALGLFTQVFSGLGALIALIPWIGPFIIKLFTIPFFWVVNALGYFVSVVAIKKGYTKSVTSSRILTFAVLTGIIIGYILGHLLPLR